MLGERVDIMTGSGGKVLSAFVEEVSPMRTHLRDEHWRPYVIPNKVPLAVTSCMQHTALQASVALLFLRRCASSISVASCFQATTSNNATSLPIYDRSFEAERRSLITQKKI